MSVLVSRKGLLVLLVAVGVLANLLVWPFSRPAQASARLNEEVDCVPLSGVFGGIQGGKAVIHAVMGQGARWVSDSTRS